MKFLVIEDEPDGAAVVEMILASVGYETVTAHTAERALEILAKDPSGFDGAIVDLALPGMDGFEFLAAARGNRSYDHMPFVAATAFHTPELKSKALDLGFDAYFAKPLDTTIFVGTLQRLIG